MLQGGMSIFRAALVNVALIGLGAHDSPLCQRGGSRHRAHD